MLPGINWVKNDPDKYKWFQDGSEFLVALRVGNNKKKTERWEYAVITVNCDEGRFDLSSNNELYDMWSWEDFEYFHLMDGVLPTAGPEQ